MAILGVSIKDVKSIEGKYILQILLSAKNVCVCKYTELGRLLTNCNPLLIPD